VVHHSHALTEETGRAELAEAVAAAQSDGLDPRTAALCAYARKLTRTPAAVREADVAALRQVALDDRAIVDANQVVAYFNYVNRVVEGLGVELEERWPAEVRTRRRYVPDQASAGIPTLDPAALPWLSVEQMREVDRLLIEEVGITLEQLMENAGRNLALLARVLLGGDAHGRSVVVLAGPGGNGGGAMVAARHLAVAGAQVHVLLAQPPARLAPVTGRQHDILRRMSLDVGVGGTALGPADLVLDGLLGYSQAGPPRDRAARLIRASAGRRVLALDVPSGLELATGRLHAPHVVAAATLTLAAPKHALRAPGAAAAVGQLYLADISVPPLVWARLGLAPPSAFGTHTIARIGVAPASARSPTR
jgi:NAD(P)H-hydrate epimerase